MKRFYPSSGSSFLLLFLLAPLFSFAQQTAVEEVGALLTATERELLQLPEVQWREDGRPLHMPKPVSHSASLAEIQAYQEAKSQWVEQYPEEYAALDEQALARSERNHKFVQHWDPTAQQVVQTAYPKDLPTFFWYPIDSTKPQFHNTGHDFQDRLFYRRRMQHWMWHFAPEQYPQHFGARPELPTNWEPISLFETKTPLVVERVSYADFVFEQWPEHAPGYEQQESPDWDPSVDEHGRPTPLPEFEQADLPNNTQQNIHQGEEHNN